VRKQSRQELFVKHYLGVSNGNASDAARRAGYKTPAVDGCRLLRNANVLAAIKSALKASGIKVQDHLRRLDQTAKGDLGDFVALKGGRLKISLPKSKTKLVRKAKEGQFGVEIELHDPIRAIQVLLGYRSRTRFLDLLKRKIDGKPDAFNLSDLVPEAEARANNRKKSR